MELKAFCFLIFVSQVQSQALLSVLQEHPELSTFNHYVNASTSLTSLLSTVDNVTLLAPSNTAFQAWTSNQSPALSDDQMEASLMYHLVHGVFPAVSFSKRPQFAGSFLTNTSYANVTGGQRVELVSGTSGDPQVVSGNQSVSVITTMDVLFTGGLIQIINTVLTVPLTYVLLVTQASLSFVVAILNVGGYLSPTDTNLVNNVLYRPNMTFFAPNTQAALNAFTAIAPSMSQEELAATFNYHAIPDFLGYSSQLASGMQLRTVEGTNVTITIQGNTTFVNSAKIIIPDYLVANGVVHLIDTLLNLSNTTGPPPLPSPTETGTLIPNITNPTGPNFSAPSPKSSLSSASKTAVGVGVPLAICSLVGAVYFFIRRMRQKTAAPRASPSWLVTQDMRNLPPQELDGRNRENQITRQVSTRSSRSQERKWAVELDGRGIRSFRPNDDVLRQV